MAYRHADDPFVGCMARAAWSTMSGTEPPLCPHGKRSYCGPCEAAIDGRGVFRTPLCTEHLEHTQPGCFDCERELNASRRSERIGSEPVQKPGRSKQDYGTPWEFIRAVEARFGRLTWDLAASLENRKATSCFTKEQDTFKFHWDRDTVPGGTQWLNPEFSDLDPYVAKLTAECRYRHGLTLLLTPASIGCGWFARHVLHKAMVIGLNPRLIFEGTTAPYPKDLMLSVYGYGLSGFDQWRWQP